MKYDPAIGNPRYRHSPNRHLITTLLLLSIAILAITAVGQQKSNCETLREDLVRAQKNWEEAIEAWQKVGNRLDTAERLLSEINTDIEKVSAQITTTEYDIAQLTACSHPALAPLTVDCTDAPQRLDAAKKSLADLKLRSSQLQQDRKDAEKQVEKLEDENRAASEKVKQAESELHDATEAYAECGAFWIGTITRTYRREDRSEISSTTPADTPGFKGRTNTMTRVDYDRGFEEIKVTLEPQNPDATEWRARVSRQIRNEEGYTKKETYWRKCEAFGVKHPDPFRQGNGEFKLSKVEQGSTSAEVSFGIYIDKKLGTYGVSVGYPALTTTSQEDSSVVDPGGYYSDCKSSSKILPTRNSKDRYDERDLGIRGTIDTKHPTILSGLKIEGELKTGRTETQWSIQLVKPRSQR